MAPPLQALASLLSRFEPLAMTQCRREINASLVGSNSFSEAVVRREQHSIRISFESLCRWEECKGISLLSKHRLHFPLETPSPFLIQSLCNRVLFLSL